LKESALYFWKRTIAERDRERRSGGRSAKLKTGTVGGCAVCGGVQGVTFEYHYMNIINQTPDDNEVSRIVVEDTIDANGIGVRRTIWGIDFQGRNLREVTIIDPAGTPQFWCRSWILSQIEDARRFRMMEYRTPAAHNVTTSTIDEFLKPCHDGNFTNDTTTLNASSGAIYVYEYNAAGDRTGMRVKKGRTGSATYLSATDYMGGTNQLRSHLMTAEHVYPTATTSRTDATRVTTSYTYTFWSGTDNIQTTVTTYPVIPTTQNGSGTANSVTDYYDTVGRQRWHKDELGYVTYNAYHPASGELAYTVQDCDPTALPSSADSNSTKWITSSEGSASSNKPTRGAGLPTPIEQVSFREYDSHGRVVLAAVEDGTDGTVLSRHYLVYETNRTLKFPYWDASTNKPLLPIQATVVDDGGNIVETYALDPDCATASGSVPTGVSATQDDYVSWTRHIYGEVVGNLAAEHAYHNIPSSGYGTKDTNYAETLAGYDAIRRQDRLVQPGGTIFRRVFDARSRMASVWVGTDDTPSSGDWSPTNNAGANMTKVTEYEYDGGAVGGNSNLTKVIQYLTDDVEANARVTKLHYDWRNRLVFSVDPEEYEGKVTYSRLELDNLDRTTKTERYYDADDDESFPDDGTVDGGDRLLGRTEMLLDKLGRAYCTKTYAVNPDNGTAGSALQLNIWYDTVGQAIKQQDGNTFTKTSYDGLGRQTADYTSYDTDETAYSDADDVSGDTVIRQFETDYDPAGNPIQVTHYARKHTASGTGALSTASARVTYKALWYDAASRLTAVANYGTNGGSPFSRTSTVPSSSDTVLVSTIERNDAGRPYKTIDPAGREARTEFDDLGRVTKIVQNYTDGNPATGDSDADVTVERTYNSNGTLATRTAKNPTTGDQITRYVYGTAVGGITPSVYRNDLLRAEVFPDSDDTTSLGNGTDGIYDRIEYLYNRQGDRIQRMDQNGTIHEYVLDKSGRLTHDRVTTIASGVDNSLLRISYAYDIRGLREKVTSYDNATVGSGNAVNDLVLEYDDMGNLFKEYQEHEGAKNGNSLFVQYNRDNTASSGIYTKSLRPISIRYPNGRLIHFTYGTSGEMRDLLSRVAAINSDNSGTPGDALAEYTYLGTSTIVKEDYPEPDIRLDYDSGTAGEYSGFDRFGRVIDQLWYDYAASDDRDRYTYGYNRASDRLYRENTTTNGKDEFYTYDEMNRLTMFDRGDLNANKDAITGTAEREEDWSLDMTGNWTDLVQKTSGTTNLDQQRTHNSVNETSAITATTGTNWVDPLHDSNGNMTTIPKPSSLASSLTATYDAWNRLVEIKDDQTLVGKYEYDGLNRRVEKHLDSDSPVSPNGIDTYVHYFYDSSWRILETRETLTEPAQAETIQPKQQYVWSQRYIDALILRDENADEDGLCDDERLYCLNDGNFNVTTLVNTGGDAVERYVYSAYGTVSIYDATWTNARTTSSYDSVVLFTGQQRDPETGLYYYRNRYYSAVVGGFISRDPIGYKGTDFNLYRYCGGEPLNHTDPTGTVTFFGGCAIGGVVSGGTTLILNWWNGDDWKCAAKKATCSALEGCVRGGAIAQFGPLGGCFGGALAYIAGQACLAGFGLRGPLDACDGIMLIASTVMGCMGSLTKKGEADEVVRAVVALMGFDFALYEHICPNFHL
jgi:RHS repeat-associated protein